MKGIIGKGTVYAMCFYENIKTTIKNAPQRVDAPLAGALYCFQ